MNITTRSTTTLSMILAIVASAVAGCSSAADETAIVGGEQHLEQEGDGMTPIAGGASLQLGMVTLRDEIIVSEVAVAGPDDIKPGFEVELFAPTTLRPIAGLHGEGGLTLRPRDMAVFNFAPVSAIAQRPNGRQDAAFYLESTIDPSGLYGLPTEYVQTVPYTGKPGVAVGEGVCDFSTLTAEDASPYPGLVAATELVDGKLHGAVTTMEAAGQIKIRLVAQVEHCAGPITNAEQANAEPRLCYEKLVWLAANGKTSTELGRLSAYRAPLSIAQTSYCGD